jgi:hypothetical protein
LHDALEILAPTGEVKESGRWEPGRLRDETLGHRPAIAIPQVGNTIAL